jgi:hypothetical protein
MVVRDFSLATSLVKQEPHRICQHSDQEAATRRWRIGATVGIKGDPLRDVRGIDIGEGGRYGH